MPFTCELAPNEIPTWVGHLLYGSDRLIQHRLFTARSEHRSFDTFRSSRKPRDKCTADDAFHWT